MAPSRRIRVSPRSGYRDQVAAAAAVRGLMRAAVVAAAREAHRVSSMQMVPQVRIPLSARCSRCLGALPVIRRAMAVQAVAQGVPLGAPAALLREPGQSAPKSLHPTSADRAPAAAIARLSAVTAQRAARHRRCRRHWQWLLARWWWWRRRWNQGHWWGRGQFLDGRIIGRCEYRRGRRRRGWSDWWQRARGRQWWKRLAHGFLDWLMPTKSVLITT